MTGRITKTVGASLEEILSATPTEHIAMFRVVGVSSNVDDWLCWELVYIKDGIVYDFMADESHGSISEFDLHFVRYIRR